MIWHRLRLNPGFGGDLPWFDRSCLLNGPIVAISRNGPELSSTVGNRHDRGMVGVQIRNSHNCGYLSEVTVCAHNETWAVTSQPPGNRYLRMSVRREKGRSAEDQTEHRCYGQHPAPGHEDQLNPGHAGRCMIRRDGSDDLVCRAGTADLCAAEL